MVYTQIMTDAHDPNDLSGCITPCASLPEACRSGHPAVAAWLDMQKISARIERALTAALREAGLTYAQFAMLITIGASEGLTQQALATRLCLTKANISQLLDRLQSAGLIRRAPEARAYALFLTDASRALLAGTIPEHERLIASEFARLSVDEQVTLRQLVGRLAED